MCNVQEGETLQPIKRQPLSGRQCMKCGGVAVALARTKDPFCRDCFQVYFTHRFRATIGKSRLIRAGEKVLLAFSGGICSRVLLALVEEGLSERVNKKLRFSPTVICIDEGAALGEGWRERCHSLGQLLSIAVEAGFPILFTRLEEIFGDCEAYNLQHLNLDLDNLRSCRDNILAAPDGCVTTRHHRRREREDEDEGGGENVDLSLLEGAESGETATENQSEPVAVVTETPSQDRQESGLVSQSLTESALEEVKVHNVHVTTDTCSSSEVHLPSSDAHQAPHSHEHFVQPLKCLTQQSPTEQSTTPSGATPSSATPSGTTPSGATPSGTTPCDATPSEVIARELEQFNRKQTIERKLRDLLESTKSVTAKENLLLSLRAQLLLEVARKYGFTKVLLGDSASRLAVRLLGNIAQGRGAALPLDTGFADDRAKEVMIVRPMREFPSCEIAMYAALNSLQTFAIPNLQTMAPEKASIERLTESFINGLQANFPSTINTIFRTGDKLTVSADSDHLSATCALCKAPCELAIDHTVFSHLSLPLTPATPSHRPPATPPPDVQLCYGCQLTVKDMDSPMTLLPPCVTGEGTMASRRIMMKKEIDEYLLGDGD